MEYIAKWGPKGFVLSPSKVIPLLDLSTAVTLKSDNDTDANGGVVSNAKSIDPQQIEFATTYLRAAGVDPRQEYEEWVALVGDTHTLYIGGQRFGPDRMTLGSISLSDVLLSPKGEFLKATVAIVLTQSEKSKTSAAVGDSTATPTPSPAGPTEPYYQAEGKIDDAEKEEALNEPEESEYDLDAMLWEMRYEKFHSPTPGNITPWVVERL